MSNTTNTSRAAYGEWKVDPDHRQDRRAGPVTISHISPDEIERRYGHIKGSGGNKPIVPGGLHEYWDRKEQENKGEDEAMKEQIENIAPVQETEKPEVIEEVKETLPKPVRKLTKTEIIELHGEGKTIEELVEYFSSGWKGKPQLLKAKIEYYLNYKKPKPRKVQKNPIVEPEPENVTNAEASDIMEPEQYSDLKEVTTDLKKQFAEAAKGSAKKISSDVDEMMEMVPDNINNPKHYTAGGIGVTDYIQAKLTPEQFEGFCIGVIIQYVSRYQHKGGLCDLRKAEWYLRRIIKAKEAS